MTNLFVTRTGKPKRSRCRYLALVELENCHVTVRAFRVWRSHVWAATVACPHALTSKEEKQVVSEITADIATFYSNASLDFEFHHKES